MTNPERAHEHELALKQRVGAMLGAGYMVSLRGSYPDTELVVVTPLRPGRERPYALWEGSFGHPEDTDDAATLIFAHVTEYDR